MTYDEIAEKYPFDFARRDADKFHYRYPMGEVSFDFFLHSPKSHLLVLTKFNSVSCSHVELELHMMWQFRIVAKLFKRPSYSPKRSKLKLRPPCDSASFVTYVSSASLQHDST